MCKHSVSVDKLVRFYRRHQQKEWGYYIKLFNLANISIPKSVLRLRFIALIKSLWIQLMHFSSIRK